MTFSFAGCRRVCTLAAVLLTATSCVEGPFERVNANDSNISFLMSLVASTDTVTTSDPIVYFQLVTNPQVNGYDPVWSATPSGVAVHLGNGVFRIVAGGPLTIVVRAEYLNRFALYEIRRVP